MVAPAQSTAQIAPDPLLVRAHIRRLTDELKLARRLLRVAMDARLQLREHANQPEKVVSDAAR